MSKKYEESEKFFKIGADLVPMVTKNPVNIYSAQKNLLTLYTYTNLEKAKEYGDMLLKDVEDMIPIHNKDLCFMLGVRFYLLINFLSEYSLFRQ